MLQIWENGILPHKKVVPNGTIEKTGLFVTIYLFLNNVRDCFVPPTAGLTMKSRVLLPGADVQLIINLPLSIYE